jgi:hypothetical protein
MIGKRTAAIIVIIDDDYKEFDQGESGVGSEMRTRRARNESGLRVTHTSATFRKRLNSHRAISGTPELYRWAV